MTPSQRAKELGCKSLTQVSEVSKTPVSTLKDWHYRRPVLFEIVCLGILAKLGDQ